jgi:DNA-binding beta-propeller fold protein YncE
MINFLFVLTIFFSIPLAVGEESRQSIVVIPGAEGGAGFDDLIFAPKIGKVLIPGGATEQILLVDPLTKIVIPIGTLNPNQNYHGGHGQGITSADEGEGVLFTIDRTVMTVNVIDSTNGKVLSSASLASSPDYVRYVEATREVWVTQPDNERIEIFSFTPPLLKHSGFIDVPGGPESLVIDDTKQRAFTHLWKGKTVAVSLQDRRVIEEWSNSCSGSRGIALDERRGLLFAGCAEGKAVVMDVNNHGKVLGTVESGSGLDVIGYNEKLSHLYLAGAQSATLSIVDVTKEGILKLLGVRDTVKGSHCVTGDNTDGIWVCDPDHGRILYFKDEFPKE